MTASPAPTELPSSPAVAPPRAETSALLVTLLGGLGLIPVGGGLALWVYGLIAGSAQFAMYGAALVAIGLAGGGLVASGVLYLRAAPAAQLKPQLWWLVLLVLLFPLTLVVGTAAATVDGLTPWLLPLAHVVAVIIPILGVLYIALWGRPALTQFSGWSHLLGGAWGAIAIALVLEILVAALLVVIVLVINQIFPDFLADLVQLVNDPTVLESGSMEDLVAAFARPEIVGLAWVLAGVFVPVIEELLKPMGVVIALLLGRQLSPRAGFIAGVLGGLGFALTESLLNAAMPTPTWAVTILARVGTLFMHATASGFIGWGLAHAVQTRRVLPAIRGLLIGMGLHAGWNSLVVLIVGSSVLAVANSSMPLMVIGVLISLVAFGLLMLLGVTSIALLVWASWHLARHDAQSHLSVAAAPSEPSTLAAPYQS